jgi:monoamine oxidase
VRASRRVAIVGAGFAGLAAALELADAGCSVTVLEARERVGGRVWSVSLANDEPAELGAEWIMPEDEVVRRFTGRFGLPLAEAGIDYRRREPRGANAATLAQVDQFLASADEAFAALRARGEALPSLGAFLDSVPGDAGARASVRARLQGTAATDLGVVPLGGRGGDRPFHADAATYHRLEAGNQAIASSVAAVLPDVRLEHRVVSVEQRDDGVEVVSERAGVRSTLRAEAVVIATPVRLVPEIAFEPSLPEDLLLALEQLPMGVASKLAVPLEGEPARRSVQGADLPFWCWVADGGQGRPRKVLTSFAGSELAQRELDIESGDTTTWLARLAELNPDLRFDGPPVMKAWAQDPLARGSYSAWDERSLERSELFRRTAGRMAFAGEHTAEQEHTGTMEGALRSGLRAATQVLELVS